MDAKETIKYLYEHGHTPKIEHYKTICEEIDRLTAELAQAKKPTVVHCPTSYEYESRIERLNVRDCNATIEFY